MVTSRIWFTAAQKAELWERWKNRRIPRCICGRWEGRTRPASADRGTRWRDRAGAAPESLGSTKA